MGFVDITSTGSKVIITDVVHPVGYVIKQGSVDAPFVSGSDAVQIGTSAVGINNDHVNWRTPSLLSIAIAVIPDSDDDKALRLSAMYNRTQIGNYNPNYTQIYIEEPNGNKYLMTNFAMNTAPYLNSLNNDGSKSTKVYTFEGVTQAVII